MVTPHEPDSQLIFIPKIGCIDLVLLTDSYMITIRVPTLPYQRDLENRQEQLTQRRDLSNLCDVNLHRQALQTPQ
jgi:hypothetical protein